MTGGDSRSSDGAAPASAGVVAIVLAAGASTRMGRPKALLDYAGESALARIAHTSAAAGLPPPLVVVGFDGEVVRAEAERCGCRVVVNPEPGRGQTSSLQVGIAALAADASGFLIWPVDAPLVSPQTLRALLAVSGAPEVVLPSHHGRRGHPAFVAAALRARLAALAPDEPASRVIAGQGHGIIEVDVDDPHVLDRINTPAEHAAVAATVRAQETSCNETSPAS